MRRDLASLARRRLADARRERADPPRVDWARIRRLRDLERQILAQLHDLRGMPFQRAPRLRVQDIDLG